MSNDKSIVFMGTPEFAVEILKHLHENNISIKGVITAPDKPAGRGRKINQSAVKKYAAENGLNVLQPTNLKDPIFINELSKLNADLFVVVAFRMLPEVVWGMPTLGTINLHASLLPNYRGAAPINWAIINGEKETGVTTFFIEKEIDTGKVIEQEKVLIGDNENVGSLYTRLMTIGSLVMLNTVNKIFLNKVEGIPQDKFEDSERHPAPKIFKQDCRVDFTDSAINVHNFIRGLSPYPTAWIRTIEKDSNQSKNMKLFNSRVTDKQTDENSHIKIGENGILFPCSDFYIEVNEIQAEGKRRMYYKDYVAGNSIENLIIPID